jgi:hypothetical protein
MADLHGRWTPADLEALWNAMFRSLPAPTDLEIETAERVMAGVQATFARLGEGATLSPSERLYWSMAHRLAVDVLRARGSDGWAKRVQLRLSDGRPLAVCVGKIDLEWVTVFDGRASVLDGRRGCGVIFEDSTRTSARLWAIYCPRCRSLITPRRTKSKRAVVRRFRP